MGVTGRPFFSIIIPVYQCERTLDNCIKSVLSQGERSCEIILVDDGSTDKSREICDAYASANPNKFTIIHKHNEGPLIARLDAINIARGQYLMFLDSDDIYLPGILRRIRNTIEAYQADMVIFNHFRVFTDGRPHFYPPQYPDGKVFEGAGLVQLYTDAITGANLNALWQKCISHELLPNVEEFRQYGRMMIGEDKLLSLKMFDNASRVVYLADGLYEYHIMQQSISHSLSLKHYQDMSVVHLQTLKYMLQWKLSDCRSLCCREKVEFGLSCLYSAAERTLLDPKDNSEFVELARNIIADQEYWNAFGMCKKIIARHKRIACWLLHLKAIRLSLAYFSISIIVKRGKENLGTLV